MSVTAWQIMALRAAKNVGCDVPADVIDRAVEYVKNCRDPRTGGYRYTRYGNTTLACTGASILSLELTATKEYHGSEESLNAAQYITDSARRDRARSAAAGTGSRSTSSTASTTRPRPCSRSAASTGSGTASTCTGSC